MSKLRQDLMLFLKKVETGEIITITLRGHKIAKLVPLENKREQARTALKQLRKNAVVGDIVSPLEEEWEAMFPKILPTESLSPQQLSKMSNW